MSALGRAILRGRALGAMVAAAMLGVLIAACNGQDKPVFNSLDITGASNYGSDFRLTDHTGKPRSMADFHGKVVVMFFGFTQCPDVCPTTMTDLKQVARKLGADAGRMQVLFVTVDPKRDTREVLAAYVPGFDPSFIGLYGDDAATRKVARDFKIIYQVREGQTPESYSVDHTAAALAFDAQGRLRLFIPYGMEVDKLVADMRLLMKGNP